MRMVVSCVLRTGWLSERAHRSSSASSNAARDVRMAPSSVSILATISLASEHPSMIQKHQRINASRFEIDRNVSRVRAMNRAGSSANGSYDRVPASNSAIKCSFSRSYHQIESSPFIYGVCVCVCEPFDQSADRLIEFTTECIWSCVRGSRCVLT